VTLLFKGQASGRRKYNAIILKQLTNRIYHESNLIVAIYIAFYISNTCSVMKKEITHINCHRNRNSRSYKDLTADIIWVLR
jgi:hypothetical protein